MDIDQLLHYHYKPLGKVKPVVKLAISVRFRYLEIIKTFG